MVDQEPEVTDGRTRRRRQNWRATQGAAIRLVGDRGFAAVTVDEIAAAAGLSRRTFFNMFPTKAAALFDAPAEDHEWLAALLREAEGTRPLWPALRSICTVFAGGHEDVLAVRRRLVGESPELEQYHRVAQGHVGTALADWARRQLPGDALRAELLARSAEAVMLAAFHVWQPDDDPAEFPRLIAQGFEELVPVFDLASSDSG
ncbi:TetR family transcriptional regulator [Cryptosporangium minutisporangium]|uniref:TetR family transcriptional regulator n=1 Tax=Cryptosporangium minutisporangium TaxID=113569 RepID=UPI0031E6D13A